MSTFYPERLEWIRKKRGLNKTALASAIDVDLRSVSAYEAGEYAPAPDTMRKLASTLRVRTDFFGLGPLPGPEADQVSFRAVSKLSATKRDMALANGAIAFAFADWLDKRFTLPSPDVPDLRQDGPEQAAMALRYMWGLGEKPVSNMVHLLESKGVRVFSLSLDITEVDAFCTWKDDVPFIFLNTKKSNARSRFDAAHELAHLVLHRHGDYDRSLETEADEFASAFLMPRNGFNATAPRLPDLRNIIDSKSRWGVSVGAYTVRLHRLGLIGDWHYRTLFQQISQRGYRKSEPYDNQREMSRLISLLLDDLRDQNITPSDIAAEMGVDDRDLKDLLFDLAIFGIDGNRTAAPSSTPQRGKLSIAVDNTK